MSETSESEGEGENRALVRGKLPAIKALEIEAGGGSSSSSSSSTPKEHVAWLKWASLGLLVFQNSGVFLMMRYTRSVDGPLYLTTVTVWLAEVCKGLICTAILLISQLCGGGGWGGFVAQVHEEVWVQRRETLRLAVPAACYTVQNNLLYLAVTHMSAAGSQVLYQSKTLSTALFSVVMLGKQFKAVQWVRLQPPCSLEPRLRPHESLLQPYARMAATVCDIGYNRV